MLDPVVACCEGRPYDMPPAPPTSPSLHDYMVACSHFRGSSRVALLDKDGSVPRHGHLLVGPHDVGRVDHRNSPQRSTHLPGFGS
jgi:hypothetical protein